MTETLPPCPDSSCTFMASEENPTGHHWHEPSGVKVHELSTEGWRLCGESRAGLFTRCYRG